MDQTHYEKPTDELRQVCRRMDYTYRDFANFAGPGFGPFDRHGTVCAIVAVQRKYRVQSGEPYSPAYFGPKERDTDEFLYCDGEGRPWYVPVKEVWRDLPVITSEELEAETKAAATGTDSTQ